MKKYSEFINFPIYLWASNEVDVEVPAEEDESGEEEETSMAISNSSKMLKFAIIFVACHSSCA